MSDETMQRDAHVVEGGVLYVVATPIGNLRDLSPRARDVLEQADVLAAEDTRVLRKLGSAVGVGTGARLTSLHEHNERDRAGWIVRQLREGRSVGLFSDAGTPLVSDPGFPVVEAVAQAELPVVAVPGPSALLSALAVAGLPTDAFRFCGFLPRQRGKRQAALQALAAVDATLVFYEAQQRVRATMADLHATFGARPSAACCDLTKRGERVLRGWTRSARRWTRRPPPRRVGAGGGGASPPRRTRASPIRRTCSCRASRPGPGRARHPRCRRRDLRDRQEGDLPAGPRRSA